MFTRLKVMRRDPTMPTSNDIDARVAKVLVQALGADECDVEPAARLKYVDHPSFGDPTAREAILAPLTHTADD
jgi:hypothetical protein